MSSIPCASKSFSSKITRLSASCSFSLCLSFSFSIFFSPFLPDVLPKSSNQRIPSVHSDGNLNHTVRYLTLQALISLFLSLPVNIIYRQKQSHPKMTLFLSFPCSPIFLQSYCTVTLHFAVLPFAVLTVIVAIPAFFAFNFPFLSTDTTFLLLDLNVTIV